MPRRLSWVVLVGMGPASLLGLVLPNLYQDPLAVRQMLRGYDLATLVVAMPLLGLALAPALRGSPRAQLLHLSMLFYVVYHYATYVFGSAFNAVFLLHAGLLSVAIAALVIAVASVDIQRLARGLPPRTPARIVAGILALLAGGLGGVWVSKSLTFAFTGQVPDGGLLVLPVAHLHLAFALDLVLLVPGYAVAAVLLWRHADWGQVLAGAVLPASVIYQLNYMSALVFQARAGVWGATGFDPAEPAVVALLLAATAVIFRYVAPAIRETDADALPPPALGPRASESPWPT